MYLCLISTESVYRFVYNTPMEASKTRPLFILSRSNTKQIRGKRLERFLDIVKGINP